MRLTVGPLPPAVYWRRRATVLGVLLVLVFAATYACGDSGNAKDSQAGGPSSTSTGQPNPGISLSFEPEPSTQPSTPAVAPDPTGPCTDTEIAVIPATANNKTQLTRGEAITLYLRIKNIGTRTCNRDIGADQQELRIAQGAQTLWSSDQCNATRGSLVQSLRPGQQVEGNVLWSGRSSANCQQPPMPNAGTYQLYGRLGTKTSAPLVLTIS